MNFDKTIRAVPHFPVWIIYDVPSAGLKHAAGKSWSHDLNWLARFDLQPLWPATDTLAMPQGWEEKG